MTTIVNGKATLKIQGGHKTYLFSRQEIDNEKIGKLTLRNIMRDLGADAHDPATTEVRLMNSEDHNQVLHVTGEELLILAGVCIETGEWTTGLGPVATVSLASPAAKEGAASGVSKSSRGSHYTSHWKICLRWCCNMRALLMTLPDEYRVGSAMAELADVRMNNMFIIQKHVSALHKAVVKVRRHDAQRNAACIDTGNNMLL